jgi:ABC-type nitrate/sulfonate/bicarbonate transport system permease component
MKWKRGIRWFSTGILRTVSLSALLFSIMECNAAYGVHEEIYIVAESEYVKKEFTEAERISRTENLLISIYIAYAFFAIGFFVALFGALFIGITIGLSGILIAFLWMLIPNAKGECPYCAFQVETRILAFASGTVCPACKERIEIRENKFYRTGDDT